jgi:hypothetical protein
MRRIPIVVLLALVPCHAHAQWLFKKSTPRDPAQRVPELIQILRTDPDERKRSSAAEELRDYDVKAHPQIIPALVEAALRDSKHGVRSDALSSLSRIRPVSPMAGQALEYAATNDAHWANRIQAKSSLLRYQWAGYTPGSNDKTPTAPPSTNEPAVAARPQPNHLPPIVNAPPEPTTTLTRPSPSYAPPPPQFPSQQPNLPYGNANPLATAPVLRVPTPQAPNPLMATPVNTQSSPPVSAAPTPNVITAPAAPQPATPTPIPSVPIVPLERTPEPNLQFRPVINDPAPATSVAPQGEIPLIDLNPVLTTPRPAPMPAAPPAPNINSIAPPVIVIPPAGGNAPLPSGASPLPTPLPKI